VEFFIDNPLVRIHFIIEMIWWTGLAPWEFEFPFPGKSTRRPPFQVDEPALGTSHNSPTQDAGSLVRVEPLCLGS